MSLELKRAFDAASHNDGYRVLVDRLWPRGVSKEEARIDDWPKEVAPSDTLRKAFHAGDQGWGEFRRRYLGELKEHRERLRPLAERALGKRVTLVFAAKDERHNNAVVLAEYLAMLEPRLRAEKR
ncbi:MULTISPECIES: DUF488 family protein [unclassified Halomonas]|uniref:DUF488 domain-containing protein n=1 Tax=unclassified Halomonas TaxID=2609666 RepID=UPI00288463DE|nr:MULTISPECIES: DUF488 family protein [unclassified Halomonas]MDT0501587.1 DUF488 family protein [Halomonas sp. PAR7]MDT0511056.1 DUF488 family protein [Halomonas sp. LES1]MDT0592427.1 DUF488 family protein [Halomonas sp. PAR8]